MNLGGRWLAAEADDDLRRRLPDPELDDGSWAHVDVPGHWRSAPELAGSDGPILYRRRFTADPPAGETRSWITFDGLFYQADVWLDGSYLGDTEGYFAPRSFEVTEQLAGRSEHLLAVEVACAPPSDRRRKRNLTGIFQHWDCLDPAWNPGGIWAPVRVEHSGPTRLARLRVVCREATAERATLDIEARLDVAEAREVTVHTSVSRDGHEVAGSTDPRVLAAGTNRVRWRVFVEQPALWWPRVLGGQPLYEVRVDVEHDGQRSDGRVLTTGLRRVALHRYVATVNGERLFLKGANLAPTRRELSEVTAADVARDLDLARDAGLDLLRVHAHVGHPELYHQADRAGMLLWQDLPLQWGYGQVRRQAVRQARGAVDLLGHHPSIAVWCGHNEPFALDVPPGGVTSRKEIARLVAGQALPTWNKTALDRSVRRAVERADGSRPVIAHSGVLPHPAWATDSHLYFGWYHGDERDLPRALARLPVLGRFISEFGAQAVPASDDFLQPERWPDLDWERLEQHHSLQKAVFDRRVPPGDFDELDGWRDATQRYQADLVRYHVETLRRLKYRPTGGFCLFLFADAQPAVSWSVLDHERKPKAAYHALAEACAPLLVVADRLQPSYAPGDALDVTLHAVSDLRRDLAGLVLTAEASWPGGDRTWRWEGNVGADSCVRIGRIRSEVPSGTAPGPLTLRLRLAAGDAEDGAEALPGPVRAIYTSRVSAAPASAASGRRRRN